MPQQDVSVDGGLAERAGALFDRCTVQPGPETADGQPEPP